MTQQRNEMIPSPELIEQWMQGCCTSYELAQQAAEWGVQQERKLWIDAINSRKNGTRQRSPIMQQFVNSR